MAIDRMFEPRRKTIAWLNVPVPPAAFAAFKRREYTPESCTSDQLRSPTYLCVLGAVVILVPTTTEGLSDLKAFIVEHLDRVLNYDCRVIVVVDRNGANDKWILSFLERRWFPNSNFLDKAQEKKFEDKLDQRGEPPQPNVRFYRPSDSWNVIGDFLALHPAGKPPDPKVAIKPRGKLSPDDQLLIERAFEGCQEVILQSIEDGKSGAHVYKVHARKAAAFGAWTQPFFVKIGTRKEVFAEYVNYEENVDPYVPFHLGPHLVPDNCCLGATRALIAGDYVEQSESLKEAARGGRAATAIACLFDQTLRGWYRNCRDKDNHKLMKMPGSCVPDIPRRVWRISRQFGATLTLKGLRKQLGRCTETPWYRGPIHGDLHSTNVRVRATDAIVIDFAAHRNGLVLRDIARLEVSLLIDAFGGPPYEDPENKNCYDGVAWLRDVMQLYLVNPTGNDPMHYEDPKCHAHWLHSCARQIRLHARSFELGDSQYAAALALELLVKASRHDKLSPFEAYRRGAAVYLAELLLIAVFGSPAPANTALLPIIPIPPTPAAPAAVIP